MKGRYYGGIYKIEIGRHCYIGRTTNFHIRYLRHKRELENNKHTNPILQRAFNKYEDAKYTVIVRANVNLIDLEQIFIDKYGTCNIRSASIGFEGGKNHPQYGKKGKLNKNYGRKQTKEHISKRVRSGKDNGMYGKTHTERTLQKMSDSRKGNNYGSDGKHRWIHTESQKIIHIENYRMAKLLGVSTSYISAVKRGKRKQVKGWTYDG